MTLEDQLSAGMREQTSGLALTGDVLGRATRNHRRRVATVRLGSVGLAAVLVAGLVVGLAQRPSNEKGQAQNPAQTQAQVQSPSLKLANAVTASDDISYRFKITDLLTYEGAFDPRTDTGYSRCDVDAGTQVELLINGTRYFGTEPRAGVQISGDHEAYSLYGQYQGHFDRFEYGGGGPGVGIASADPGDLFKALRDAGATTTENPDGTLHFRLASDDGVSKSTQDGDVTINADGRIAKVVVASTWSTTIKGRLDQGQHTTTVELSDYGLAVSVERPARVTPA
jgi:hypothetical protein